MKTQGTHHFVISCTLRSWAGLFSFLHLSESYVYFLCIYSPGNLVVLIRMNRVKCIFSEANSHYFSSFSVMVSLSSYTPARLITMPYFCSDSSAFVPVYIIHCTWNALYLHLPCPHLTHSLKIQISETSCRTKIISDPTRGIKLCFVLQNFIYHISCSVLYLSFSDL